MFAVVVAAGALLSPILCGEALVDARLAAAQAHMAVAEWEGAEGKLSEASELCVCVSIAAADVFAPPFVAHSQRRRRRS